MVTVENSDCVDVGRKLSGSEVNTTEEGEREHPLPRDGKNSQGP